MKLEKYVGEIGDLKRVDEMMVKNDRSILNHFVLKCLQQ
ncbi:hypothetical protein MC28_0061 [Bacillus thuringiensis MC28]|nr:hypothetical protein MC28_0061 [Bacillus thuringiensis MC28]